MKDMKQGRCFAKLPCGHLCSKKIHSRYEDHECEDEGPCQKINVCGKHKCLQMHRCALPCPPCRVVVEFTEKLMKSQCPHSFSRPCYWLDERSKNEYDDNLVVTSSGTRSSCKLPCTRVICGVNHLCNVPCNEHLKDEYGRWSCPDSFCAEKSCNKLLPCQHLCALTCEQHDRDDDGDLICPLCTDGKTTKVRCRRDLHDVSVPCYQMNELNPYCSGDIEIDLKAICGHIISNYKVACSDMDDPMKNVSMVELQECCEEKCKGGDCQLACGHFCQGWCARCFGSSYHPPCTVPCTNVLICEHQCMTPCPRMCGPCQRPCDRVCEHGPCKQKCCRPCDECEEPCEYQCPHFRCSRKCKDICDRAGCQEPCPKKLECGHLCAGWCGEPCPPLCIKCDKDELLKGMFLGETEIEEDERFIYLPACGHTLSSTFMDGLMKLENSNGKSYEIAPKRCPLCNQIIYNCRRYSEAVHRYKEDVDKAKTTIYGRYDQIVRINRLTLNILRRQSSSHFDRFRNAIYLLLCDGSKPRGAFRQMDMGKAKSLEFLAWIYSQLASMTVELESEKVPRQYIEEFETLDAYFTVTIASRPLPLSQQDALDTRLDLIRMKDLRSLFLFRSRNQASATLTLMLAGQGEVEFDVAHKLLCNVIRYGRDRQTEVHGLLTKISNALKCTLKVSDDEHRSIVTSFGPGVGRFFRCPNGHCYVITECGGAMEEAVCPECKESIGGYQHRVLEGNQLATEMDGATSPIYPNAV